MGIHTDPEAGRLLYGDQKGGEHDGGVLAAYQTGPFLQEHGTGLQKAGRILSGRVLQLIDLFEFVKSDPQGPADLPVSPLVFPCDPYRVHSHTPGFHDKTTRSGQ